MNLYSLNTVAIALIALGLIIPTGAVMHLDGDEVSEEFGVVLMPHDGPNGEEYAKIQEGNLSIDLATVGVNPNALTSIRNLFDTVNNGDDAVELWITHNASGSVTFSVAEHGELHGPENAITLEPGEGRTVDLLIDTEGKGPSEDPLLRTFDIHVVTASNTTPTPTPTPTPEPTPTEGESQTDGGGSGGTPERPPTATPTPEPTPTPTPGGTPDERVEDVEVIMDDSPGEAVMVQDVPVDEVLESDTEEDDAREPRAVIDVERDGGGPTDEGGADDGPSVPDASDAQTVVEEDEEVRLSAERSVVGSVRSVDQERRLVKAADITPPAGREDSPATIRMRVNEERFEGSTLSSPRIGRQTEEGWQMLSTRIVGREDGQLILEARTPGFSRFAVFATPDVRYTWELGNETITREELRTRFDEPGFHNVTLTVTDALGRSNTATYRVLVNDRPGVSIDVPANRTNEEPLTLRANVSNEVGNATVTWLFPDGSQQEGLVAEHTFGRSDQPVRVTVEDEYGASTTVEQTITIGPVSAADLVIQRIAGGVPLELALGAVALLAFLLAILVRRILPSRGSFGGLSLPSVSLPSIGGLPVTGSQPQITTFQDPTVDVFNRRFQIGHLQIEDPGGDLQRVEIVVTDSRGNEVAQKTVDLRDQSRYDSRGEVVPPKSKVYVRDDDEYEISVRAGDGSDGWTHRSHSPIRAPDALVA